MASASFPAPVPVLQSVGDWRSAWADARRLGLEDGLRCWLAGWSWAPGGQRWGWAPSLVPGAGAGDHWAVQAVATRGCGNEGYLVLVPRSRAAVRAVRRWRVLRAYRWLRATGVARDRARQVAQAAARIIGRGLKASWVHEVLAPAMWCAACAQPADVALAAEVLGRYEGVIPSRYRRALFGGGLAEFTGPRAGAAARLAIGILAELGRTAG